MIPTIIFLALMGWQHGAALSGATILPGHCYFVDPDMVAFDVSCQQPGNWWTAGQRGACPPGAHEVPTTLAVIECVKDNPPTQPFDVPPVERRDTLIRMTLFMDKEEVKGYLEMCADVGEKCVLKKDGIHQTETLRSCTDKSRFLLKSEDGKWHCLRLAPQ
jgi:hypothetical protein